MKSEELRASRYSLLIKEFFSRWLLFFVFLLGEASLLETAGRFFISLHLA